MYVFTLPQLIIVTVAEAVGVGSGSLVGSYGGQLELNMSRAASVFGAIRPAWDLVRIICCIRGRKSST